jgi:hypothetical protein
LKDSRGLQEKLIGRLDAEWCGIESVQSGFPFTPQLGFNPINDGDSRNPICPSWNPDFSGPVVLGGPNRCFNPHAFVLPPPGTYGNDGRDILTGPGRATLGLSLAKLTPISDRPRAITR